MATQTWIAGKTGDWFTAANWTSGSVPAVGDTALIGSGTPTIAAGAAAIEGVTIVLGGSQVASPVTLEAIDAKFVGAGSKPETNTKLIVTGGQPATPLNAIFLVEGNTSFDGQILVTAVGGSLTIDSQSDGTIPGNFSFLNTDEQAVMVVTQESCLLFRGQTITNNGLIQVEGGVDIGAGVAFGGTGTGFIVLENGGQLSVEGVVDSGQQVNFVDGTGMATLANTATFLGVFGFTNIGGNRIDVVNVQAQSANFVAATANKPGILELYAGPNQTGAVTLLSMQLIDSESWSPLPFGQQELAMEDFAFGSDGNDGTRVTYTPQSAIVLYQSLPVPIVASAGTTIPLSTILTQSFGTATPGFYSMTLVPSVPFKGQSSIDSGYWASPNATPVWLVGGNPISASYLVKSIDDVELQAGNQINSPAQIQAQVTPPTTTGPDAVSVLYDVWTVDPSIVQAVQAAGYGGTPTPGAVKASAIAFNKIYPLVPNTNLCDWIADNVAAGAGASMPLPNQLLDASLNVPGGFWRIFYTGTGAAPVSNWSTLLQLGDIVRMGWFKPESGAVSGHTTTVLCVVNVPTQIEVYDNIDFVKGSEYIGIHDAAYWLYADPADITIYRLDPNQQYLILGSGLGEMIQGSVFNNLIQPGGGGNIITAGAGNNVIQGTTAQLNGITVTDFHAGDTLDFTDLDSSQGSVSYSNGTLVVWSGGSQVAAVTLPAPASGDSFSLTSNGSGGSLIGLSTTLRRGSPTD